MDETPKHPLLRLSEEDLNMVMTFVLASGSLKDLAARYGVSYPTIRQRLDRLIERLRKLAEACPADPVEDELAELIAAGQIAPQVARRLRTLHREALAATRGGGQPDQSQETQP